MMNDFDPGELAHSLHSLAVFMDLYEDEVFRAFLDMLDALEHSEDETEIEERTARFAGLLYRHNTDCWSDYLSDLVLSCDTVLARFTSLKQDYTAAMLSTAMRELEALAAASGVTPAMCGAQRPGPWIAKQLNMQGRYLNRLMEIERHGTGIFPKAKMFRLADDEVLRLIPVKNGDPVTFAQLYGYEEQHNRIIDNTKALLLGLPCSNLLLYGDAGTGKSASIKAVVNLLGDEGLKLIEVGREQLSFLPELLDVLAENPLRFIVYIDDLSFGENDDSFSALKAVLEGSVCTRSANTVIYATSNRRHLVKESMSARTGDDMHRRDTLQETLSLSQRFGECLFFEKPDSASYLALVDSIAREMGLKISNPDRIHVEAASYAIAQGGRSARAARQFVEHLAAKEGLENDVNS